MSGEPGGTPPPTDPEPAAALSAAPGQGPLSVPRGAAAGTLPPAAPSAPSAPDAAPDAVPLAVVVPDLRVGGLQAMAVRLALALDRAAFRPVLYTFDGGGPLEADLAAAGIAHVHLPRGSGADPGHARRLAARFTADGIRLVHCHNVTALFHGARAGHRAGRLPVLYTEHDRDMPAPLRHRLLHRWLARRVARTVAVSARLRDALVRWEGFPPERTSTLVNGIDDPRRQFPGPRQAARSELGWDDAPVALAVGSLTEVKNHAGLIEAFAAVRERLPRARLAIAGTGELQQELQRRAAALPPGAVTLLGERRDVARLLAACDVFVLSSRSEGLSLSLVEAHAMGRASVAFDVGGNGEVLQHGVTGLLAPPLDLAALSGALVQLLADGGRRALLEGAARGRYLAAFTHERMLAGYVGWYRALLDAR
ncbi:MAG TPA: glycosyltransferase, partial [Planctomycetota bacterium]|nr:glycosyltransferase [Planctomycetota bacterium]